MQSAWQLFKLLGTATAVSVLHCRLQIMPVHTRFGAMFVTRMAAYPVMLLLMLHS